MTFPNQISTDQANAAAVVNEELGTLSAFACYGKKSSTTTGLTWGYYGGRSLDNFSVSDGTLSLTPSSDNYVVVSKGTGAISVSTASTNWNDTDNYARVYKITTGASTVSGTPEDHRATTYGVFAGGGGTGGGASDAADVAIVDAGGYFSGADVEAALQEVGLSLASKATTAYVDAAIAGLSWKQAVRVATTAAGTLASSFENGDTVDGVTLATGDRILIKNQSTASENGIYVVAASGAPARAIDANSGAELVNASVYVSEGTTNADTQWTCTTNSPITVGSTSIAFAQLTSGGGQAAIQFKDEGSNVGASGGVSAINFVGSGVTASESGGVLTVTINGGGSSVTTKLSEVSFTRPADTTAYAIGDVLADSTSAATILTFTNIGASNGGGATLLGVTLIDSVAAATPPDLELYLFDTAPTMQNDNAAWNPTDAEMKKSLGYVPLFRGYFKTAGANGVIDIDGLNKPIICAAGTTSIYGILVHRQTYTPTSGEEFTVRLRYAQG